MAEPGIRPLCSVSQVLLKVHHATIYTDRSGSGLHATAQDGPNTERHLLPVSTLFLAVCSLGLKILKQLQEVVINSFFRRIMLLRNKNEMIPEHLAKLPRARHNVDEMPPNSLVHFHLQTEPQGSMNILWCRIETWKFAV